MSINDQGQERTSLNKPCTILVEGPDDEGFFNALAKNLGLVTDIQIVQLKGRNNLKPRLRSVKQASRTTSAASLGIVLDCETDPSATFQQIQEALRDEDFAVPADVLQVAGEFPQIVFTIFPDSQTPGMIEDVCLRAFSTSFPEAMVCVEQYFECFSTQTALFSATDLSKAKLRAFLSAMEKAETRLGIAAQKDWWSWDNPVFDDAKKFLRLITSPES